jgi:hypothetical protein
MHTVKYEVVVLPSTGEIIRVSPCYPGSYHDSKIYRMESLLELGKLLG